MTLKQLITSPFKFLRDRFFRTFPKEEKLSKDSGMVIEENSQKVAVYKDSSGKLYKMSAICTHLGCVVYWNNNNKRWDCPCHGSIFDKTGKVLHGPAKENLKEIADDKLHKVRISAIEQVTHDVKRFILEKPKDYKYIPGQATLIAINKDGFRDTFKPFTFTSLNKDKILEFIIKSYPTDEYPSHDGITEKLHTLKPGDTLIIKEPFGTIHFSGKGVFLAGGAGITPFIAILRDLKEKDKLEGNKLIFSNKTKKDVILEKEFRSIFKRDDLVLTLSREKVDGFEQGRIGRDMIKKHIKDFSQRFYVCGPPKFVEAMKSILEELGARSESIVFEE